MNPSHHVVLILAAGGSRRLGTAKQLLRQHGVPLIRRVCELALATQPLAVWVVTGAQHAAIVEAVQGLPVQLIANADWASGMASSLQAGATQIAAHAEHDPNLLSVLILSCDQLRLTPAHLHQLLQAGHAKPDAIVASAYADSIGIPVLLPTAHLPAIMSLRGDGGLKPWLHRQAESLIKIAAPELAFDLDTPADRDHAIAQHWLDPS